MSLFENVNTPILIRFPRKRKGKALLSFALGHVSVGQMTSLLFLLALTSLSASPLFVKWSQAPIEFLCFWRLLIAGLLFLLFVLFRHRARLKNFNWDHWKWAIFSGVFFFMHLWTYVASAKTTSVAHLTILYALNPIFTVAGAAYFFGEKMKRRVWLAYPLAFVGLCLLMRERVSGSPDSEWGDLLAVISAVFHAGYLLAAKKARRHFDNSTFSIGLYLTAALLFALTALLRGSSLETPSETAWPAIAGLILFPTLLGHALMTQLVSKMDLSVLSCGKLLEPGISSLMAFYFFNETLSLQTWLAFALTCVSVSILFWPKKWMLLK